MVPFSSWLLDLGKRSNIRIFQTNYIFYVFETLNWQKLFLWFSMIGRTHILSSQKMPFKSIRNYKQYSFVFLCWNLVKNTRQIVDACSAHAPFYKAKKRTNCSGVMKTTLNNVGIKKYVSSILSSLEDCSKYIIHYNFVETSVCKLTKFTWFSSILFPSTIFAVTVMLYRQS